MQRHVIFQKLYKITLFPEQKEKILGFMFTLWWDVKGKKVEREREKQSERWKVERHVRFEICKTYEDVSTHHTGSWAHWTRGGNHKAGWILLDTGRRWSTPRSYIPLHMDMWIDRVVEKERERNKRWVKYRHLAVVTRCQRAVSNADLFLSQPYHRPVNSWLPVSGTPPFTLTNERELSTSWLSLRWSE